METEMPRTSKDTNKIEIKFSISPTFHAIALEMAASQGLPPGEFHRKVYEAGLSVVASADTQILINKKTRMALEETDT